MFVLETTIPASHRDLAFTEADRFAFISKIERSIVFCDKVIKRQSKVHQDHCLQVLMNENKKCAGGSFYSYNTHKACSSTLY